MREVSITTQCNTSAADFWSLRSDRAYDEWFAQLDGQVSSLIKNEVRKTDEELTLVQRTVKLQFKQNPVPHFLRKKFGLNEFAFLIQSAFHKEAWDEAHPYTYSTEFPVLTDRIHVEGAQWVEELSEDQCRLHARVRISVQLKGLGPQIEKQIEKGVRSAYTELPERACDYLGNRSSPSFPVARRYGAAGSPPSGLPGSSVDAPPSPLLKGDEGAAA